MQDKLQTTKNGYVMLGVAALVLVVMISYMVIFTAAIEASTWPIIPFFILMLIFVFLMPGFFIIDPNQGKALVLFGKYVGTVREDGFHWANPFYKKISISLRVRNLVSEKIKVNDKNGNPVVISVVIVWKVADIAKALFAVDHYEKFVYSQSESALRSLAGKYPYDNFEDSASKVTLRNETDLVSEELVKELHARLERAGVVILEARINHLAYAEEIASAMLQRQQASAIVAARKEIVEGAVGMVEMALNKLADKNIVHLDEERKAAMVSNLLVVLSGNQEVHPVVNTGTLYN